MYGLVVLEVDEGATASEAVVTAIKAAMEYEFRITFNAEDPRGFKVQIDQGWDVSALSGEAGGLEVYKHGPDAAEVKYVIVLEAGQMELKVFIYVEDVEDGQTVINLDWPLKRDYAVWELA